MKRIISLALICVMLTLSLLLTACDIGNDVITDTETKPVTEKQTETETETEVNTEPVPVDSLGGKNPKQLFLQFYDEYTQSKGYDITVTSRTTEDGVMSNQTGTVKVNETSIYVYMKYDDEEMKVWYVDGIMYTEMDGEKVKTSNSDIDDIFGDGFIEQISSTFPDKADLPQTYLDKLEKAQLYSYDGLYYCTVNVTDSEAQEMGEEKGYKETLYFDANGKLKKAVDEAVDVYQCLVLTSYGTTVVINAPADAHNFKDMDSDVSSGGDNDPQAYAKYTQVCDLLDTATTYAMDIDTDETYIFYEVSNSVNKHVRFYLDNGLYHIWKIGSNVYVYEEFEGTVQVPSDDGMLSSFESMKDYVTEKISINDMSDLTLYSNADGYIISFVVNGYTYYSYIVQDDMSCVQVTIDTFDGNEVTESITYFFSYINDSSYSVEEPYLY